MEAFLIVASILPRCLTIPVSFNKDRIFISSYSATISGSKLSNAFLNAALFFKMVIQLKPA